eukprot:1139957-Prorocentrum_minimum.AAC.2
MCLICSRRECPSEYSPNSGRCGRGRYGRFSGSFIPPLVPGVTLDNSNQYLGTVHWYPNNN